MQTFSKMRYAHISPQKCRLIADVVRGKRVGLALSTLRFMPKKGAELVLKTLESAVANAEHNHGADIDELKISRHPGGRSAAAEALCRARQGPRQPHRQAYEPHHRSRQRRQEGIANGPEGQSAGHTPRHHP